MEHDNTIPRFGNGQFQSFNEMFGYPAAEDSWSKALSHVGQWRPGKGALLRDAKAEKIEGGDIKLLQPIGCSQGLKLGISEGVNEAELERTLHTILTIAGIAASRARNITDREAKENAIDEEAREQAAAVFEYINAVLKDYGKEEVDQFRPLYDRYGKQVTDLIFATRNGVLANMDLLNEFYTGEN